MTHIQLGQLLPGDRARVCGFVNGTKAYRQKLLSMGLTPNTCFEVIRKAPFGDPVMIKVRQTLLSLRREEAAVLRLTRAT